MASLCFVHSESICPDFPSRETIHEYSWCSILRRSPAPDVPRSLPPRTGAVIARKAAEGIIGKGNERRDDRIGEVKHCTPAKRVQETFSLPYNDAFFEVDSIVQTSKHIHPEQSIVLYGRAIMGDNDYIPITLGMNPKG